MGKNKTSRKVHILSKRRDRSPVRVTSDHFKCSEQTERIQLSLNNENEMEFWRKKMDKPMWDDSDEGYKVQTVDVELGNADHAKLFLSPGGLDVDRQTKDGRSALMLAAKRRNKEAVECLLDSGANVMLEDRLGATALCFAFSQEQMEIAEVLQRNLSFKDRDVYVKRRVELLHNPRHNNSRHETASFYKRVLFRVLLKIKKAMCDGVQLLVRHRVFPALMLCSGSNLVDGELQRLVFHLSACLMYGEGGAALVVEEVAGHFLEAEGPEFCVRAMQEMSDGERWIALLPVYASVECPAGRQWLKENCPRILEYMAGFRDAMPDLRYWTTDEYANAEVMLRRFEEAVAEEDPATEIQDDEPSRASSIRDNDDKFVSNLNSANSPSIAVPAKKKKIGLRHKFRKIKFPAKNPSQMSPKAKSSPKAKITLKPGFKFLPNNSNASSSLDPDSLTGYADALKKNLSSLIEDGQNMDEDVIMVSESKTEIEITALLDSQLTKKPIQLIDDAVSYSPATVRGQKILNSPPKYQERNNSTDNVSPVELLDTIRDGYNFWSQVPILTEYSSSNSSFREWNSSPIPQNFNIWPKWECGGRQYFNEHQPNSESLPDKSGQDICRRFEWYDGLSPPLIGSSTTGNVDLPSELKLTAEDEENLCRQFKNLALDDELGSKEQLDESGFKFEINSKDKSRRKSVASKFLSEEGSDSNSARENTRTQNGFLTGKVETCETLRRTYSDVTRCEDGFRNRRYVVDKTKWNDVKPKDSKGPRKYSDVTRVGVNDIIKVNKNDEISRNDEINRNEIEKPQLQDCSFLVKPERVETNGHGDSLSTETYLEQFECEISKEEEESAKGKKSSDYIPVIDFSLRDFEMNCLEAIHRPNQLKGIHQTDKSSEGYGFEAGEIMRNQNRNRTIQQIRNKIIGQLWGDGDFCTSAQNLETVWSNTEWKYAEKSTCLVNSNYSKKKSKKISYKAIMRRVLLLETLTMCPMTLKLNLETLKKNTPLFQRSVPYELRSSNCQHGIKTISNLVTLCRNFEKEVSLKCVTLPKYTNSNTLSVIGTILRDPSSENGAVHVNDFKLVGFLNNLLKLSPFKTSKTSESLPKKEQDVLNRRRQSKEKVLIERRIPVPETSLNEKRNIGIESGPRFLDSGYVCGFVHCQTDSKWYTVLKGMQSCVPLSQHLLPPTEIPKYNQTTDLCSIYSKAGKIVFSTKLEHTLRKGTFGTYIGILEDGNPVVVRQLSSSAIYKDITALNLSKKHLLKHKNLTTLYDAQINLRDLTMSLVYELCEYSLPEYMRMRHSCKFRTMAPPSFFRKLLIMDLFEGIRYLHGMKVVHGFLKPSNLMVTIDDCLKLTDYHLLSIAPVTWGTRLEDPKQSPIGSALSKYCWRPTELIKAENATEAHTCLTTASDIQMCGMLVFYLLSGGRHPFGSTDYTCQENIKLGTRLMGPHPENTESRDLICEMIKGNPEGRPTVEVALRHPYFWDQEKRFKFLLQVGNKVTFYTSRPNRAADDFRKSCIEARNWITNVPSDLMRFIAMCTSKTFKNEFSDLLQFAVALQKNFETMPHCLKTFVQQPSSYILQRFPTLFMSIYYVIRCSPMLITQMGLQHFF